MNQTQANITNLNNLWKIMGASHQIINQTPVYKSDDWPSRLWVDWDNPFNPTDIDKLLTELEPLPIPTVFPVWITLNPQLEQTLKKHQLEVGFQQTGMVLNLHELNMDNLQQSEDLVFKRVATTEEANSWAEIVTQAFGTYVPPPVIYSMMDKPQVHLLLAYKNDIPVATTILFDDRNVIGVHTVGVALSHRRQGIARYMMHHALKIAKESGRNYATLQASAMGAPLYTQLGFQYQFTMTSFVKK